MEGREALDDLSGETFTDQFKRYKKDGKPVWLQATYIPMRNGDGSVTTVMKIATDITSSKLAALEADAKLAACYFERTGTGKTRNW